MALLLILIVALAAITLVAVCGAAKSDRAGGPPPGAGKLDGPGLRAGG